MDKLQRQYLRNRFGVESQRYKQHLSEQRAIRRQTVVPARVDEVRRGAEQRGLDMRLTSTEIELYLTGDCHYCGTPCPTLMGFHGIDRVDNTMRHYSLDNCVSCCALCNRMKGTLTVEEFRAHVEKIHRKMTITFRY
jgi:5-methylcytosine-specific restriction endonuclease McrA